MQQQSLLPLQYLPNRLSSVVLEGNTEIKAANNVTPSKEQSIDDQIKASSRMTITAGNDEQFEIGKECWGGFGQLFSKEVAFCIIEQAKSMSNMLMDQSDNYKISFTTSKVIASRG